MKMNKWFMLGMVGLAFTACSNEEELGNQLPEGVGAVTINIVSPAMTKSVNLGTTTDDVKVVGDVTITLDAVRGSNTINLTAQQLASQSKVTFWNVETPRSVTVSMNGGKNSYTDDAPTIFENKAPASIPAYGETTTFKLTARTGSPTGSVYEDGAAEDGSDDKKVYQLYEASVQLAIPVARLEVSGIQHITDSHATGDCKYKTLTIAGVYLDNVYEKGFGVTYANGAFPCVSGEGVAPKDYSFDGEHGTGDEAILSDEVPETNDDFLAENAVWPEANNAYSYYFFGANGEENLPKFKIYFSESEANNADEPLPAPRYAMITSYKQTQENGGATITQFVPGHIYKIVGAKLSDENILGDEGGNTLYGVEVTVEEATWTVETIDANWAQ